MEETRINCIQCITEEEKGYPRRLKQLPRMPKELYFLGKLPKDQIPTVGIVGARRCSSYGRYQARRFGKFYSSMGIQVISGMALGIDGAAHEGALAGGTPTFAVMGCGVDICYPRGNQSLYKQIKEQGGILSEFPEGAKPEAWHFPVRNRIISALSDVVLVVEAREKSGSLITVDYALEQGKNVYAVPGDIQSELSRGCHKLISQGAGIAYGPEALLPEWNLQDLPPSSNWKKNNFSLARDLELVYSCLDLRPKTVEVLREKTGYSPEKIRGFLLELELSGLAEEVGKGNYVKR